MKKYIIYNKITNEEYVTGYNDFTAMNNLISLRNKYGEDAVSIKWTKVASNEIKL